MLNQHHKVLVSNLKQGDRVARDVVNDRGHLIIPKESILSDLIINRLTDLGIRDLWIIQKEQPSELATTQISTEILHSYTETVAKVESLFEQARLEERIDIALAQTAILEFSQSCQSENNILNLFVNLRTFDEYTFQHSIGVGLVSRKIGQWLGFSEDECDALMLSGSLHDIGKCNIDNDILNKPGRLTPEEYEIIKQHTTIGYRILLNSDTPEHIALGAYGHHERMDGNGYPRKLKGHEIDLFSRIIAVADVFNAMTSRRIYKDPVSLYRVLDEIHKGAFGELDPQITTVFINKMTAFLNGNNVELSDGTHGKVVFVPVDRPTRPLIQTMDGTFLDLKLQSNIFIERVHSVK